MQRLGEQRLNTLVSILDIYIYGSIVVERALTGAERVHRELNVHEAGPAGCKHYQLD